MRALVVGAGPSGLAAAIVAAEHGVQVRLLDRRSGPLEKACGEGIVPPGVAWLQRHGVDLSGAGQPFVGIRYIDDDLVVDGKFRNDTQGYAVRRTVLSQRMHARARELGVVVEHGADVSRVGTAADHVWVEVNGERLTADFGIAADGLHGRVGAWVRGAESSSRGTRSSRRGARFGVRAHVRMAPWTDRVEVYWSDQGEAYVTPVSGDSVGVAILGSATPMHFRRRLAAFPRLLERLGSGCVFHGIRGAGPLHNPPGQVRRGRFGVVGDGAGYLDACTGEGLSLAFASAEAWVHCAVEGREHTYRRSHRRLLRRYWVATSAVLALTRSRRLRRLVMHGFRCFPPVFSRAVSWAAG